MDDETLEDRRRPLVEALRGLVQQCRTQREFLRRTRGRCEQRLALVQARREIRARLTFLEGATEGEIDEAWNELLRPPSVSKDAPSVMTMDGTRRAPDLLRAVFGTLATEHEEWLSEYAPRHTKRWREQFGQDGALEGAIWEALCRRWLQTVADVVEPAEDEAGKGPDFRCVTGGYRFYVEATCMSIDTAQRATGLDDVAWEGGSYALATKQVWDKVEKKVEQCRARSDAPTVLFIGTIHQTASWIALGERVARELLTGELMIAFRVLVKDEHQTGASSPFSSTKLEGSAFVAADGPPDDPLGPRNQHVAAVLVGDSGMLKDPDPLHPPPFIGAVHPEPAIPFDPLRALPGTRFFALSPGWRRGNLQVHEVHQPR